MALILPKLQNSASVRVAHIAHVVVKNRTYQVDILHPWKATPNARKIDITRRIQSRFVTKENTPF